MTKQTSGFGFRPREMNDEEKKLMALIVHLYTRLDKAMDNNGKVLLNRKEVKFIYGIVDGMVK